MTAKLKTLALYFTLRATPNCQKKKKSVKKKKRRKVIAVVPFNLKCSSLSPFFFFVVSFFSLF